MLFDGENGFDEAPKGDTVAVFPEMNTATFFGTGVGFMFVLKKKKLPPSLQRQEP